MAGPSDRDRAYLMALGAWKTFGHSSENPEAFAQRISQIGESEGLMAAAEAVAEDCRQQGLEMSAQRVLKGLAHDMQRQRATIATPGRVQDLRVSDLHSRPPGLERLLAEPKPSRGSQVVGFIVIGAILATIAWLIFS